ncbi:Fatty acid desaturase [Parasphingorhabdus marina DSM 22363]|uniref:Fatty acid desaturase n=1 Tax=Parasphingorhabdus marina DSM 22363 TaxID=1123272 RepID=A0A1N6CUL2_9SPHN|nr:fatty acid desaturase [Parasphingorhabdus marina]SIN62156.1 Fatty acid desaturase [Parasphingorhabdus marina DSM 22363]
MTISTSPNALRRQEQQIARKYAGRLPWEAVIWGLGNLAVWLALWPLVFFDVMPLWLAFPIATLNVMLCYLPSHEAQHDIIGRKGTKWRWLNELVGHLSTIPLVLPYRVAKVTHIQHHLHANDPDRDPDYSSMAPGPWQAIWKSIQNRQPGAKGGFNKYGDILRDIGREDLLLDGALFQIVHFAILIGLALSGHAIEAALLWWLPRQIGLTYIQFFLSWAPHHPADGTGRYRDTRAFRSSWGNIGSMGMQYHIVHHLHPYIPLTDTPAAYRDMRHILEQRGCRLENI